MIKVLVITKDATLEKMLYVTLTINGLTVKTAPTIQEGRSKLSTKFDIILLDADFNGSVLWNFYQQNAQTPILFLGRPEFQLRRNCDFIYQPFLFIALKEKMNHLLVQERNLQQLQEVIYGDLKLDPMKFKFMFKDKSISLGKMEFAILNTLMKKKGDYVCKDKMTVDLQKQGHFFTASLFQHVGELKRILRDYTQDKFRIKFVLGEGYRLIQEKG
ncbi:MAG: response regulator transcription factor [Bacteriovoracaceae bacterium]